MKVARLEGHTPLERRLLRLKVLARALEGQRLQREVHLRQREELLLPQEGLSLHLECTTDQRHHLLLLRQEVLLRQGRVRRDQDHHLLRDLRHHQEVVLQDLLLRLGALAVVIDRLVAVEVLGQDSEVVAHLAGQESALDQEALALDHLVLDRLVQEAQVRDLLLHLEEEGSKTLR